MAKSSNFIKHIIQNDVNQGKNDSKVITRFPPEPNGYLHLGHAKSICLNFGMAEEFNGPCHLRFDDTNPTNDYKKYMDAIASDVKWLGFDWGKNQFHASDYFDKLHAFAIDLIKQGKAFVCDLNAEEMRAYRGTLTEPGKESPYRNRSVEENLDLFERMTKGEFEEGQKVLRAKIDMASPNVNLRDPVIYRIRKTSHPRTGDKWCVYPMYDYTHCVSDALELITHSLCTLEFEDHRPLYDWCLDQLAVPCHPQQIEFARLNLNYTVMSKRKLVQLVNENHVQGWDDPRMPTISGVRRRGFPPEAIRLFCDRIGIGKKETVIDYSILEDCVREVLNEKALRRLAVLDPLKITITNFPDDPQEVQVPNHPQQPDLGKRPVLLGKEIYIERDDFMEEAPKDFFRLKPGGQVRLRYGYVIQCEDVIKNDQGEVVELKCTYFPETFAGKTPEGMKKVKGIIHWVSAQDSVAAEVRVYDRLFSVENPLADKDKDFLSFLNPDSLKVQKAARVEKALSQADSEQVFQFERLGYFCADKVEFSSDKPVFNRTVTLRDTWTKLK
ncbi:MAG: glutamine--tRNA ligase/YqeY domain fusion protein [Deltaproteobacteria bacterium]|nr:glutamine--tRNA ligase/YqeY domain fusion protein [Deltaproteobacteria bacterium]